MKGILIHPSGVSVQVKAGFSWTMLFFGVFVPLIRGDIKWFAISLLVASVTFGAGWFVLPFFYNRAYIRNLLVAGYKPEDEKFARALEQSGVYIAGNGFFNS